MIRIFFLLIFLVFTPSIIQCDITNLNDFLSIFPPNTSISYSVGFLSKANIDVVKRYLPANVNHVMFTDKNEMLKAIDNETIIAAITTGQLAQDLEPLYHVFSSLIISPQAMLVAPGYSSITPYGLENQASNDLYDALNAAIAETQRTDMDETLLTNFSRTDLVRVYTCHQDSQLPVANRNETSGYLRDILFNKVKLKIGGIGPSDWGAHDGNYNASVPTGFYPKLLDAIVDKLRELKGPDGIVYGKDITFERVFYPDAAALFYNLLNGSVHATDVYILIDAPYTGTNESCLNNTQCRPRESCEKGVCTHPARPRSLHFRTTCTTASRDTKFITKKDSKLFKTTITTTMSVPINNQTNTTLRTTTTTTETLKTMETPKAPKTRWIGFLLVFVALFGIMFLALLILIRRKKHYRIEHTLQGGFGKFARLREESEPPLEGMDAFDDHIVQSPTDNTNSTS